MAEEYWFDRLKKNIAATTPQDIFTKMATGVVPTAYNPLHTDYWSQTLPGAVRSIAMRPPGVPKDLVAKAIGRPGPIAGGVNIGMTNESILAKQQQEAAQQAALPPPPTALTNPRGLNLGPSTPRIPISTLNAMLTNAPGNVNIPPELAPTSEAQPQAYGVGQQGESDAEFWRRKQMEWNRLDAQRAVDKSMSGRGDVMNLWKEAIKAAGIGSTTGGIKLARQSQNAIQLLNHLLDAQGKAEANAIAGAEGIYGRDIAGFGAESADRYHQAMANIAAQKLPSDIELAKSHQSYYNALAQGVPNKEEAKKMALDSSAREAILKQANIAFTNGQYPDLDSAIYDMTEKYGLIEKGMKGEAAIPQSKLIADLKNDKVSQANLLRRAKTDPRIAAFVEAHKEIFK